MEKQPGQKRRRKRMKRRRKGRQVNTMPFPAWWCQTVMDEFKSVMEVLLGTKCPPWS